MGSPAVTCSSCALASNQLHVWLARLALLACACAGGVAREHAELAGLRAQVGALAREVAAAEALRDEALAAARGNAMQVGGCRGRGALGEAM